MAIVRLGELRGRGHARAGRGLAAVQDSSLLLLDGLEAPDPVRIELPGVTAGWLRAHRAPGVTLVARPEAVSTSVLSAVQQARSA